LRIHSEVGGGPPSNLIVNSIRRRFSSRFLETGLRVRLCWRTRLYARRTWVRQNRS